MKKVFYTFILLGMLFSISADSKDEFLEDVLKSFNEVMDVFVVDYSKISGLYTTGGFVRGGATVGNFPAFRVGASVGTIFFNNPISFLKKVSFSDTSWDDIIDDDAFVEFKDTINWFDENFIPVPVTNFHFEIGLPKGLSVGTKFHVAPLGNFINLFYDQYLYKLFLWGIGVNFSYTLLKEYKFLPSMSINIGCQYSDIDIDINSIPVGETYLDSANDQVDSEIGFASHFYNTSFFFDLTISKKLKIFQPYINLKFVQTIDYNVSTMTITLDRSDMDSNGKELYGDGIFEITNVKEDDNGNELGKITPVTDFIVATGFEFVMKIFRLGIEGAYGVVSQKGMVTLGLRFHVEDNNIAKLKKGY